MSILLGYFLPFVLALREQLVLDDLRWGDTWMEYPLEGQEERTRARFRAYFDQRENARVPVPWLKVAGGAFICWVRELLAAEAAAVEEAAEYEERPR